MSRLRKIPYGVMNWEKLVHECHFVDNTGYIRTLEDVETPVFLRPKRFGKSLVCSMLAHYYDIALKDRFEELFGKTEIGRDPTPLHNAFLVLEFDFSTITVGTLAEIERNFTESVRNALKVFATRYAKFANWSQAIKESDAASMIECACAIVRTRKLPPLYVIIDEYDNFSNELVVAQRDADYDAICGHTGGTIRQSYFKAFFKSFKAGLKDGTVGKTYFTGVLPITLDDLSSGYNVGTIVNLRKSLLGLVGFTQKQVERYVDEIIAEHELPAAWRPTILGDLKRLYDGYRFLPGAEPLYNATVCNWYLDCLVADREIPATVIDSNLRTDIGWFQRLTQTPARALEKARSYIERGEGERADITSLAAKFGRGKFFSEEFYPYALYYLGLLTFDTEHSFTIPNPSVKNMFVDYYNELADFTNVDEARRNFVDACAALILGKGSWQGVFEQYWLNYVKARIPAQAFDKINENFFRTAFTSRCLDSLAKHYSFETEYNSPEGRCDFLAVPRPGNAQRALLIGFKYFTMAEVRRRKSAERKAADAAKAAGRRAPRVRPDEETKRQALAYRKALLQAPGWTAPVDVVVVEVHSHTGYRWLPIRAT